MISDARLVIFNTDKQIAEESTMLGLESTHWFGFVK
jgi:hypothetical protein